MAIVDSAILDSVDSQENLDYFTLFTTLNITATGNFADSTHKDFVSVIQVIGMQTVPVITREPLMLDGKNNNRLENFGAPTLTGPGWKARLVFEKRGGHTIEKLKNELNGIVLNSGVIDTKNAINMEFTTEKSCQT